MEEEYQTAEKAEYQNQKPPIDKDLDNGDLEAIFMAGIEDSREHLPHKPHKPRHRRRAA